MNDGNRRSGGKRQDMRTVRALEVGMILTLCPSARLPRPARGDRRSGDRDAKQSTGADPARMVGPCVPNSAHVRREKRRVS